MTHSLFVLLLDGFCVVGGEQAGFTPQLAFPPVVMRALQDLDDVAGGEVQLVFLHGLEVVQSFDLRHEGFVLAMEETNIKGETH